MWTKEKERIEAEAAPIKNNGRTGIGDAVLAKVNQELADKNLSESEIRQLIDTLIQQEMDQRPELEDIYFVWFGCNIAHNTKNDIERALGIEESPPKLLPYTQRYKNIAARIAFDALRIIGEILMCL